MKYFIFCVTDNDEHNVNAEIGIIAIDQNLHGKILHMADFIDNLDGSCYQDAQLVIREHSILIFKRPEIKDVIPKRITDLMDNRFKYFSCEEITEQEYKALEEKEGESIELCQLIVDQTLFSWKGSYENGMIDFETADIPIKLIR